MGKYWPRLDRANKSFTKSGSDNSNKNTYTYNELGFRGDSIHEDIELVTIGCSHTEGIGVNDNETWSYYLAQNLGVKHINMGFTGRSNDYISRMALEFLGKVLPTYVVVMYTYPERREYYTEYGYQPWHPNPWGYFEDYPGKYKAFAELSTSTSDYDNYLKNRGIVELMCNCIGTNYAWNGSFVTDDHHPYNRVDGDYSIQYGNHATSEENKKLADHLFGYLR